jgi:putative endopeptidase
MRFTTFYLSPVVLFLLVQVGCAGDNGTPNTSSTGGSGGAAGSRGNSTRNGGNTSTGSGGGGRSGSGGQPNGGQAGNGGQSGSTTPDGGSDAGQVDGGGAGQTGSGDAQTGGAETGSGGSGAPAPLSNGIDETAMDPAANPCDDFYKYACGGFVQKAVIPADEGSVGLAQSPITRKVRQSQRELLEAMAAGQAVSGARYGEVLGTFFRSCNDFSQQTTVAEAEMMAALKRIDAVTNIPALFDFVADEQMGLGFNLLFRANIEVDDEDSSRRGFFLRQGGYGLYDSAIYAATDADSTETKSAYRQMIASLFALTGAGAAGVQSGNRGYTVEAQLARGALTQQDLDLPEPRYVPKTVAELKALAPTLPWDSFLRKLGLSTANRVVIDAPRFLQNLETMLKSVSLADWRDYLRTQTLINYSSYTSQRLFDVWFKFYGTFLSGIQTPGPRGDWCVTEVSFSPLIDALAEPFAARAFSAESREQVRAMAKTVGQAMSNELMSNAWMDAATKAAALKKLEALAYGIGYPDKWRDLSAYKLTANASFLANSIATLRTLWQNSVGEIDKPVNREEWRGFDPTEVNAFYSASYNRIVLTSSFLQSPYFDRTFIDAANYGSTGATIGHEITHAFDSSGRFYGATGNLEEWFTPASVTAFEQRSQCLVDQFDAYTAYGTTKVSGERTLPENIADLGGVKVAYKALKTAMAGKPPQAKGKLNDDQIFFVSYAQSRCSKWSPEYLQQVIATDPHAPDVFRINGALSNLPEFAQTFSCPATSKMVRAQRCQVW